MIYRATTLLQYTDLGMKFYRCTKLIKYEMIIGTKRIRNNRTQCRKQIITYNQ